MHWRLIVAIATQKADTIQDLHETFCLQKASNILCRKFHIQNLCNFEVSLKNKQ